MDVAQYEVTCCPVVMDGGHHRKKCPVMAAVRKLIDEGKLEAPGLQVRAAEMLGVSRQRINQLVSEARRREGYPWPRPRV